MIARQVIKSQGTKKELKNTHTHTQSYAGVVTSVSLQYINALSPF